MCTVVLCVFIMMSRAYTASVASTVSVVMPVTLYPIYAVSLWFEDKLMQ